MDKVDQVLTRGVEQVLPSKKGLAELMKKKKITLYQGFDPSMPSLHLGNFVGLMKLGQFQKLGHKVIFLVGDFTGMIGDPSDKLSVRKKLSRKEVTANAKSWKKQASAILNFDGPNAVRVLYNSAWLDKVSFRDLIELTSHFTLQQILERDTFKKRNRYNIRCRHCKHIWKSPIQFGKRSNFESTTLKNNTTNCPKCNKITNLDKRDFILPKPIYLHEFLYPVAQGYDSVAMDVDLEIGGNDQLFNMMAGRTLMKATKNKEKYVLTTKLLVDKDGNKAGKTSGNALFLDSSPKDFYGGIMTFPDETIYLGFELLTELPLDGLKEKIKQGPMAQKKKLAFEVTKIIHGETNAKNAQEHFENTFQKKAPDFEKEIKSKGSLVDTLANIISSKSEAKRLIRDGAVDIDGKTVKDPTHKVSKGDKIKVGKKIFVRVS